MRAALPQACVSLSPSIARQGSAPDLCIHAYASTSGQWRGLMELLAPKFHILAPDSYDADKSPHWSLGWSSPQ